MGLYRTSRGRMSGRTTLRSYSMMPAMRIEAIIYYKLKIPKSPRVFSISFIIEQRIL
jgi:hypothetical protein